MSHEQEGAGIPITAIHINLKDRSITFEAEGQTLAKLTLAPEGVIFDSHPNQEHQQDESSQEIPARNASHSDAGGPALSLPDSRQVADRPNSKERKTVVLTGKLVEKPKKGKPDRRGKPTAWARFAAHVEGEDNAHDFIATFHKHTTKLALALDEDAQITVDGYPHPSDSPKRLDTFSVINLLNYPGKPQKKNTKAEGLPTQADGVWSQTLEKLKEKSGQPAYETWLKDTSFLELEGNTAIVSVASPFAKEWLERRLYQLMVATLQEVLGKDTVDIHFLTPS